MTIVKCMLHISPEEQEQRLIARLDDPTKRWKYNPRDLEDRALWDDYMAAYADVLERCDTDAAPWYVVPPTASGTATGRSRGCCASSSRSSGCAGRSRPSTSPKSSSGCGRFPRVRTVDLDAVEVRVLGCLIEKQRTTPDVYPLSLNSLRAACNQSTNRDPVVQYDEAMIRDALHRLARRRWTRFASGARAAKYRHLLDETRG